MTILARTTARSASPDASSWEKRCSLTGPWSAARLLAHRHPQAALLLPNSFRTALTVRLARTPIRAGYRRDGREGGVHMGFIGLRG